MAPGEHRVAAGATGSPTFPHPTGSFANLAIASDGPSAASPASGASDGSDGAVMKVQVVPIPAALWLFASAFLGLCWLGRRSATSGVGMLPR